MGGEGGNELLQDLHHLLSMTSPRRWRVLFWSPSPPLLASESFVVLVEPRLWGLVCCREALQGQGWGSGQRAGRGEETLETMGRFTHSGRR